MALGSFGGGVGSLGNLYVKLGADVTDLTTGMGTAEKVVSSSVAAIEKSLLVLTAALVAAGVASVNEYSKFNKAMTESTAIMGDVSDDMRKQMEVTARSMAMEGRISADKLAGAYYGLASAGLDAESSMKALPIVARLAEAGLFDVQKATDNLIGAQNALGLAFKDPTKNMENMARLSDLLAKVSVLALGKIEDFSDALSNKAAAAMKTYNIEVEDGIAVLGVLGEKKVKGLKAGEEFSIMMVQLQTAFRDFGTEFKKMGVVVADEFGQMESMSAIFGSMEKAFAGMPPTVIAAKLALLGFQDRSIQVILNLLGSSEKIKQYRDALKDAGGTAKEIADKNLTSFSAQLTITWNIIKDLMITIGEGLAPALLEMNNLIGGLIKGNIGLSSSIKEISAIIGEGLLVALRLLVDLITGTIAMTKGLGIAMVSMGKVVLDVWNTIMEGMGTVINWVTNAAIKGINTQIQVINAGIKLLPAWMQKGLGGGPIPEVAFRLKLDWHSEGIEALSKKLDSAGDDMIKSLTVTSNQAAGIVDKTAKKTEAATVAVFNRIETASNKARDKMLVLSDQMTALLDRMDAPNKKDFNGNFIGMSATDMKLAVKSVGSGGNDLTRQFLQNKQEMEMNKLRLDSIKEMGDKEVKLIEGVQMRKKQAIELYMKQTKELQHQQTGLILNTTSQMFMDLSAVAKQFGGEQAASYKALFAMAKAFAVAKATVDISLAIADVAAGGLTFYEKIADMAAIAAATSSIVQNIASVGLAFGGGKERGGPVSSGQTYMIGEKGPELFAPSTSGTIVPNHALGAKIKVEVHNNVGAQISVTETQEDDERKISIIVDRAKNEIAAEVTDGRGRVTRAFQNSYKLRRGRQ